MSKVKQIEAKDRSVLLLDKGIDLVNRRMIIGIPYMEHNTDNDVNFPLAANFFTGLHALEYFYVPEAGKPPKDHIDIEFVSYGGDVYTSLGIFDRLVMSSVPVHMYVYGPCMSGGSIILQAAEKRFISPHSRLMLHYGFMADEGTSDPKRLKEVVREHEELMETLTLIYLSRAKKNILTKKILQEKILPIETYINATKCIEYGLADQIIEPY